MDSRKPMKGRDELNLIEFPIALISDRAVDGVSSFTVEDEITDRSTGMKVVRRVTVSGNQPYGLPTAQDEAVIVALIAITKEFNDFASPHVEFVSRNIIKLLGWPRGGKSYDRLAESLLRWTGVMLVYDNAWRNHSTKSWDSPKAFHIIEESNLRDTLGRSGGPPSYIRWSNIVWSSFAANYTKPLDLAVYYGLGSAVSRRMYRYLDKWFFRGDRLSFDLHRFAFNKILLSQSYDAGQIKRKLRPAIAELEEIGFLKQLDDVRRFERLAKGAWNIVFIKGESASQPVEAEVSVIVNEGCRLLLDYGVGSKVASELAQKHSMEMIEYAIDYTNKAVKTARKPIGNPMGFLVDRLQDESFRIPPSFVPAAVMKERELAIAEQARAKAASNMQNRTISSRVDAYKEKLGLDGVRQLGERLLIETGQDVSLPILRKGIAIGLANDEIRRIVEHDN